MIEEYCYKINSKTKNGNPTTYIVELNTKMIFNDNSEDKGIGTILFGEDMHERISFDESDIIERFGILEEFKKFNTEYWI